jgi:hypothetical protein
MRRFRPHSLHRLLALGMLMAVWSQTTPALASLCAGGTVADVLNTSCTVGNLQFSFQQWSGLLFDFDMSTFLVTQYTGVAADSVLFAPNASGFTLTAPDQSVASSGNFIRTAEGELSFFVSGLNGYTVAGVLAEHTGAFDVAGNGTQGVAAYGARIGPPGIDFARDAHRAGACNLSIAFHRGVRSGGDRMETRRLSEWRAKLGVRWFDLSVNDNRKRIIAAQ